MKHTIQEAITDYINKFVISVKEVIISEAMPIEFIKVIDVDENAGMWTLTRTPGQY